MKAANFIKFAASCYLCFMLSIYFSYVLIIDNMYLFVVQERLSLFDCFIICYFLYGITKFDLKKLLIYGIHN